MSLGDFLESLIKILFEILLATLGLLIARARKGLGRFILSTLQSLRQGPRPPLDLPDPSRKEGIPQAKPQERVKAPQEGQGRLSQPSPLEEAAKPQRRKPKPVLREGDEILKGVIWSEILKKPKGW